MDLDTVAFAAREACHAGSDRGSTGEAITARPDPFATRTMTRTSSVVHPCTTISATAVAYRAALDLRTPS